MIMLSRGIRNNNPFNIKLYNSHWKGRIDIKKNTDGVFEQFVSMDYGLRAGVVLLRNYIKKYHCITIKGIVSRFAPASENDVEKYVSFLCDYIRNYTSFPACPNTLVDFDTIVFWNLCCGICLYESRFDVKPDKLISVYKKFK